jgi:transcription elongation factor GreA
MDKFPITPDGYNRLRDELHNLRSVERPHVIQLIATAREHGDLKENAEYHAARERQGFIEARIKDLEAKFALAEVIDPVKIDSNRVAFGAFIKISNTQTGEESSYQILGAYESDLANGQLSVASPLARSFLGKEAGDEVKVRMPGGDRVYEILEVGYPKA